MAGKTTESKKKKHGGTFGQLWTIYKYTAKGNKALPWLMLLGFLVPVALFIILSICLHANVLLWILYVLCGVLLGVVLAVFILTRISDRVGYKQLENQPGASAAVLANLGRSGFEFSQEPVWVSRKTRDTIWRGTGRPGIFLIGEGDKQRLNIEMNRQEAMIHRLFPGSKIKIYRIYVGQGEGYTPIAKLRGQIVKHAARLTKMELHDLNGRLQTMQTKQSNVPHGIDPNRLKVNSRMMRHRN